jgi:hypothetical protein
MKRGVRIGDGASFQWGTAGMFLAGDFVRKELLMMLSDETKYSCKGNETNVTKKLKGMAELGRMEYEG